jgi:prepilin-type N-terminal cleavage/methylation domain-containing protein
MRRDRVARVVKRARRGMTLLEVLVAMTMLAGAMLSLTGFALRLAASSASAKVEAIADELASDRLEQAKTRRTYAAIDSLIATENPAPGPRGVGFVRKTAVKRVGGLATDSVDYRIVTVEVTHFKLLKPALKSITIAAY